jgi:hypothetical protein
MLYEVVASRGVVNEWRVEAIDENGEGQVYVTIFSGPDSRQRAEEYAYWKNAGDRRTQRIPVMEERRRVRVPA